MNIDPDTPNRLGRAVRILSVVLALALAGRGLGYIGPLAPDQVAGSLAGLDSIMPMTAWAIVCFVISVGILAGVVFHRRFYTLGLTAYCALNGAWIVSYLASWVFGISDRAWITGIGYIPELAAAVVLLIIGPPRPLVVKPA